MTTMEMDAKKAMLARELLNIEDMDVLKKIERFFRRATKTITKEEDPYFKDPENLKRLDEAIEEMENGEVVRLTRDELKQRLGL